MGWGGGCDNDREGVEVDRERLGENGEEGVELKGRSEREERERKIKGGGGGLRRIERESGRERVVERER